MASVATTMIATTVYPNDPERTMQLRWWDEQNVKYFAGLTLAKGDTGPGGGTSPPSTTAPYASYRNDKNARLFGRLLG